MLTEKNDITYQFIRVNNIKLNVALSGPAGGDPVILLHGFPDASFGWDAQIRALADAGFYVIAPDQRGYNLSDKPNGVDSYRVNLLVSDVIALADALGISCFNLAGHDWGALVCWNLVELYPERVKRLAILNVPHPRVMNRFLKTNWRQQLRSWYAFFFQIPFLPEISLSAFNWKAPAGLMCKSFSEVELNRYKVAWSQPGAMTAMINWYRALFLRSQAHITAKKIRVPTLMIWGKLDPHLMWQMAPESIAMCEKGKLEYVEDATHWVHQDKPELVNRLLLEHFQAGQK
ncbi:MAG: alpha/beta hydrolase [Chloroflexota bacterium]